MFKDLLAHSERLRESQAPTVDVSGSFKFRLVVRKRPLLPREVKDGELDIISNSESNIRVHECKTKVDGITKYIQTSDFAADRVIGHQT